MVADLILVYLHRPAADMVYITEADGHQSLDITKYSFKSFCQIDRGKKLGTGGYGIYLNQSDFTGHGSSYKGSWFPGTWDDRGTHWMGPGYACYGVTKGQDLPIAITAETYLNNSSATLELDIYGYDLGGKVLTEQDVIGYMRGKTALTPALTLKCKVPYVQWSGTVYDPVGTVKYDASKGTIAFTAASGRTGITCQ